MAAGRGEEEGLDRIGVRAVGREVEILLLLYQLSSAQLS